MQAILDNANVDGRANVTLPPPCSCRASPIVALVYTVTAAGASDAVQYTLQKEDEVPTLGSATIAPIRGPGTVYPFGSAAGAPTTISLMTQNPTYCGVAIANPMCTWSLDAHQAWAL